MFRIYGLPIEERKGEKPEQIGGEYTAEGPAKQFADMCKKAGYRGVVVKCKSNVLDNQQNPVLTKTGRESVRTKVVY